MRLVVPPRQLCLLSFLILQSVHYSSRLHSSKHKSTSLHTQTHTHTVTMTILSVKNTINNPVFIITLAKWFQPLNETMNAFKCYKKHQIVCTGHTCKFEIIPNIMRGRWDVTQNEMLLVYDHYYMIINCHFNVTTGC